jgi:TolB-like protein/lipopolysaccharide biosynthesis regulator YciM
VSFFEELRRRNVIRVGVAYVVAGWLLAQVIDLAADAFNAPDWVLALVVTFIAIGLVPVLMFSWAYEITPEGIKRESEVDRSESITDHTGRKLNVVVIVLIVLAVGIFVGERAIFYSAGRSADPLQADGPREAAMQPAAVVEEPTAPMMPRASGDASVAVLPFTTRSMDEADRFFSDGVHDDLLTQLAKIGSLKVISRTSVMEYRDTIKRIPDIAAELGVATVVEGAVQRSGNMVRITAQLIDAQTDEHLWAESYDRELTAQNLFAIQTEIATSIAGALQATLSPEEKEALQRPLTADLPALEAYQRARYLMRSFAQMAVDGARRELEFAVERDPGFAAAWALLARVHLAEFWFVEASDESRRQAREAIDRARAIDRENPEVDIAEGYYYYWGFRNYEKALEVLAPAAAAYPNDGELHTLLAFINRRAGHFEACLEHIHRAFELDPRSPKVLQTLVETYTRLGDYARAEEYTAMFAEVAPDSPLEAATSASLVLARDGDARTAAEKYASAAGEVTYVQPAALIAYLSAGDRQAALEFAKNQAEWLPATGFSRAFATGLVLKLMKDPGAKAELEAGVAELAMIVADTPEPTFARAGLCHAYGALGDVETTRKVCRETLEKMSFDAFDEPSVQQIVARGYAAAGLREDAFEVLAKANASPVGPARKELELDPFLVALHDDPRWEKLIAEAHP